MKPYDVAVVGGGPAGATAAALCAAAGLRTVVIERSRFPRDKVCGDCLNPGCWDVFEELQIADKIDALPGARLRWIEFAGISGRRVRFELPDQERIERGIRRYHLDYALVQRASDCGAEVRWGEPIIGIEPSWKIKTASSVVFAKFVIAADGRNSTVARLLRDFPVTVTDRVAFQTHFERAAEAHIALELCPEGYIGLASIGEDQNNLCLVCRPGDAESIRRRASETFDLPSQQPWTAVTPLTRAPIQSSRLFYVGDAARVVEPFTGEGILYALRTGSLAAQMLLRFFSDPRSALANYRREQRRIYRGRLWVNQLARFCVLHPRIASRALDGLRFWPWPLKQLTSKVVKTFDHSVSAEID